MPDLSLAPLSLEDAKSLVTLLENGDDQAARELFDTISSKDAAKLFSEVGKLTRQLHNSLNDFQFNERIVCMTNEDIPDAHTRLMYVIETTQDAANKTMDLVESCMPIGKNLYSVINSILPEWKQLKARQLELGGFDDVCHNMDAFLLKSVAESTKLNELLTEVLLTQGYQDLTAQVLLRVIDLVKNVEDNLIHMLTMFGEIEVNESANKIDVKADSIKAEGPILNAAAREDVASDQDDVDDLLSSLGF